jgi:hypothetical protein
MDACSGMSAVLLHRLNSKNASSIRLLQEALKLWGSFSICANSSRSHFDDEKAFLRLRRKMMTIT